MGGTEISSRVVVEATEKTYFSSTSINKLVRNLEELCPSQLLQKDRAIANDRLLFI